MRCSPRVFWRLALAVGVLVSSAVAATVPRAGHVYVVLLENHSYAQVVGGSSTPYLNSLISQYALATNYFGNTHPSIGNYFMLTTGQIISNNDAYSSTVSSDNVVRHFLTAGVTWKAYAESLPYAGYIGGDQYPYIKHHNPFAYFSDVRNSSTEKMNIVPFSQFPGDLSNGRTPDYSFIVPNNYHNSHDCPQGMSTCTTAQKLQAADNWLKANLPQLFSNPSFQQDGLLVIVFDESVPTDTANGGGHIVMVAAGPKVKRGYKATGFYQHQNLLRMLGEANGLTSFPGAAANASNISPIFVGSSSSCTLNTSDHTVTICAPLAGTTYKSPVHVVAQATSSTGVGAMAVYVDGVKAYHISGSSKVDTYLSMNAGTRRVAVQAWDPKGLVFKTTVYATVN